MLQHVSMLHSFLRLSTISFGPLFFHTFPHLFTPLNGFAVYVSFVVHGRERSCGSNSDQIVSFYFSENSRDSRDLRNLGPPCMVGLMAQFVPYMLGG